MCRKVVLRSEEIESGMATWLAVFQILGRFHDAVDILNWPLSISLVLSAPHNNQSLRILNDHKETTPKSAASLWAPPTLITLNMRKEYHQIFKREDIS